jgi:hypothetical protein
MAMPPESMDLTKVTLRLGRDQVAVLDALRAAARTSRATIARQLVQEALDARARAVPKKVSA